MRFLDNKMGKDLMKVIYSASLESNEYACFLNPNRSLFKITRALVEEAIEKELIHQNFSADEIVTMII